MGPEHLTTDGDARTSGGRWKPRECLRKGCGRTFQPRQWNQRYCREPGCQREVKRWLAAKRQRRRRATPEGRARHAEQERQRRKREAARPKPPQRDEPVAPGTGATAGAWSRSTKNFPAALCDRPGCYEPPRDSPRASAHYCGDACCEAMRRVRDRERKYLSRKTPKGRLKRRREYQAAKLKRCQGRGASRSGFSDPPLAPSDSPQGSVLAYGQSADPQLGFSHSREVTPHDSQTTPDARPRAPPAP